MAAFTLRVNGARRTVECAASTPLLWVLRDHLHLTGAKYGCGEGQCGACTVLVGGRALPSCTLAIGDVGSRAIVTIEGLASGDRLHPLQQAFLEAEAFQCGYCTPGMILGAAGLLARKPKPSDAEIAQGLESHICRCGAYPRIIQAVRMASRR